MTVQNIKHIGSVHKHFNIKVAGLWEGPRKLVKVTNNLVTFTDGLEVYNYWTSEIQELKPVSFNMRMIQG